MPNPTTPQPSVPPKKPVPPSPPDDTQVKPSAPEVNPAKPGNQTEVDLDKSKTKTYPEENEPQH